MAGGVHAHMPGRALQAAVGGHVNNKKNIADTHAPGRALQAAVGGFNSGLVFAFMRAWVDATNI